MTNVLVNFYFEKTVRLTGSCTIDLGTSLCMSPGHKDSPSHQPNACKICKELFLIWFWLRFASLTTKTNKQTNKQTKKTDKIWYNKQLSGLCIKKLICTLHVNVILMSQMNIWYFFDWGSLTTLFYQMCFTDTGVLLSVMSFSVIHIQSYECNHKRLAEEYTYNVKKQIQSFTIIHGKNKKQETYKSSSTQLCNCYSIV